MLPPRSRHVFMDRDRDHASEEPGQSRAMCGGIRGNFGIGGNVESVTCTFAAAIQGSTPTSATITKSIT
jgi:hypothetical protein